MLTRSFHRRCFYINLPLALPPAFCTIFFLKIESEDSKESWQDKLKSLDYLGMGLLLPMIICLILSLEYGNRGEWGAGRTIGCFVASGILMVLFVLEQWWMGEKALVPPRIFKKRVVVFAALYGFCIESAFLTLVYYVSSSFKKLLHQ